MEKQEKGGFIQREAEMGVEIVFFFFKVLSRSVITGAIPAEDLPDRATHLH